MYQTQNLHVPPEIRTAIVLSFLDVCLQCGSPILEQCNLLPTIVLLSSDLPTTDSLKRGHGGFRPFLNYLEPFPRKVPQT